MSQNHRPAAPAIDPTKKSSLFEVPLSNKFNSFSPAAPAAAAPPQNPVPSPGPVAPMNQAMMRMASNDLTPQQRSYTGNMLAAQGINNGII
jgi:hypothetical protein